MVAVLPEAMKLKNGLALCAITVHRQLSRTDAHLTTVVLVLDLNLLVSCHPFQPLFCEMSGSVTDGWFEVLLRLVTNEVSGRHGALQCSQVQRVCVVPQNLFAQLCIFTKLAMTNVRDISLMLTVKYDT